MGKRKKYVVQLSILFYSLRSSLRNFRNKRNCTKTWLHNTKASIHTVAQLREPNGGTASGRQSIEGRQPPWLDFVKQYRSSALVINLW